MTDLVAPAGIKLVALDIDGTLADDEQLPPVRVADKVREVHAAGIEIMLVTGRQVHAAHDVARVLGLPEIWVGSSNGAVTSLGRDGGWSIVSTVAFDPRPAADAVWAADPDAGVSVEHAGFGSRSSIPLPTQVAQPPLLPWEGVPASTTFAALASRRLTRAQMAEVLRDVEVNVMAWDHEGYEVADLQPAHVSKASAVEALATLRGLVSSECAAIGDYTNDTAMLQWVGWGVAMGHAPEEVKAAADAVAPSLVDDGVLAFFDAILAAR